MTTSDLADLKTRVAELERRQRTLRRLAWGTLSLLPIGLGAFTIGAGPVVRAERVELITASGSRQAVMDSDSAGVTLTLFTTSGRPASAVRLTDSTLALLDARGRTIALLGGPVVRHLE